MTMEKNRTIYVCECGTLEHQIVFDYYFDDSHEGDTNEFELYIMPRLNNEQRLWSRIKSAIKYILKKDDANYAEILFFEKETDNLIKYLTDVKKVYDQ